MLLPLVIYVVLILQIKSNCLYNWRQNLDISLIKLAIQRISEDCQLIIDGDYNSQVDLQAFEGNNNGMRRVSEIFRGQSFYGEVELPIIYRSKMAEWAEIL